MQPTLTPRGLLHCPGCRGETSIPEQWNPSRNQTEKLILLGDRTWRCPLCGTDLHISEGLARAHNRHWYPDDPAYRDDEESLYIEYTRRSRDGRQRLEVRLTSEGRPLLPGLVRAVQQIAGPAADQLALEFEEG